MSGIGLGTVIDLFVALLLVVTIGYCTLLNRRLKAFRGDEEAMRQTIRELVQASEIAERAIAGLKETATECDKSITYKLRQADRFCRDIEQQVESGQALVGRLSQIGALSRELGLNSAKGGDVRDQAASLRRVDTLRERAA